MITIYYAPEQPSAFDTRNTQFEHLLLKYGRTQSVKIVLKGGTFNTIDMLPIIAASYLIRTKQLETSDVKLYEWQHDKWKRIEYDIKGDLISELLEPDELSFYLRFDDNPFERIAHK